MKLPVIQPGKNCLDGCSCMSYF